jgi:uracil phosphoribosyltransferase
MRDKSTESIKFRTNLVELSQFMAYEVTKSYKTTETTITTPLAKTKGFKLQKPVVLVPILRAGLGMLNGFLSLIPNAPTGFIGLYRNEKSLQPVQYYCKLPECTKGANVIILDPMLATGNSSIEAINIVKKYQPASIKLVCIVSAPIGIKNVMSKHKDVDIYTAAVDAKLNNKGYIVPGLGDAGDRIFGTK